MRARVGSASAARAATARSYTLIRLGPISAFTGSSKPAGSAKVESRSPSRRPVSAMASAKASTLPLACSARAYEASLADTIIMAAMASSRFQRSPSSIPIFMAGLAAARALTTTGSSAGMRRSAVSAVTILTVLAGSRWPWRSRAASTRPVATSTNA